MATRFTGSIEDLKLSLASLSSEGEWIEVNPNQHQFRHTYGGIMNWFPSTGSLNYQGKPSGRDPLKEKVSELLNAPSRDAADLPEVRTSVPVAECMESHATKPIEPAGSASQGATTSIPSNEQLPQTRELRFFGDSEIIIGLVGAIGTNMGEVTSVFSDRLQLVGYAVHVIKVSSAIIPKLTTVNLEGAGEAARIRAYMDAGDRIREKTIKYENGKPIEWDYGILANGAAAEIASIRGVNGGRELKRTAFIIDSLKHPDEIHRLRQIYPRGFYLIGVHPDEAVRTAFLKQKGVADGDIDQLVDRDADEYLKHGQRVNDAFHLSDFFVRQDNDALKFKGSVIRIFDILFGSLYTTPTFDEFAMFLAFTASLRSADLSRQVGAVVARGAEILGTGANDCPKYGGGLYWPELSSESHQIEDKADGRDYRRGEDSNKIEQRKIIEGIIDKATEAGIDPVKLAEALKVSRIKDLTEYGRVVHAEMEALMSCARNNVSTRGTWLFCTTFPCHNCAKHIIAAGVSRVVYIEPYQKSKAVEFHSDAISVGFQPAKDTVHFEPFVGVGPRRFFDLFSMSLGAGYPIERKDDDGLIKEWGLNPFSKLRVQMLPGSYIELEAEAASQFERQRKNQSA
jgi:deoxycytidylate deaminase